MGHALHGVVVLAQRVVVLMVSNSQGLSREGLSVVHGDNGAVRGVDQDRHLQGGRQSLDFELPTPFCIRHRRHLVAVGIELGVLRLHADKRAEVFSVVANVSGSHTTQDVMIVTSRAASKLQLVGDSSVQKK